MSSYRTYEEEEEEEEQETFTEVLKSVGWFAFQTAAITGVILGGIAIAVPALGFTASGVAAGSAAAAYQRTWLGGTIAAGSAFAKLQSVGAAGLAVSTKTAIAAGSAAATGAYNCSKKKPRRK